MPAIRHGTKRYVGYKSKSSNAVSRKRKNSSSAYVSRKRRATKRRHVYSPRAGGFISRTVGRTIMNAMMRRREKKSTSERIPDSIKSTYEYIKVYRKSSFSKAVEGHWKYIDQMCNNILGAEGKQQVFTMGFFCNQQAFITGAHAPSAVGQNLDKNLLLNGLFNMNPWQIIPGATDYASTTWASNIRKLSEDRMWLEYLTCNYSICNMANIPCWVEVYVVTPRYQTAGDSPQGYWNTCLTGEGSVLGTLNVAAAQATNSSFATAGYPDNSLIGQKPTDNPSWNKAYKVLSKKNFYLGPGANVDYKIKLDYHWLVDRQTVTNLQQSGVYGVHIPYKTVWVFGILRGGVVQDTGGSPHYPSYGVPALGIVNTATYYCRQPKNPQNRAVAVLANPALLTGTDTSALQFRDFTDAVVTEAGTALAGAVAGAIIN